MTRRTFWRFRLTLVVAGFLSILAEVLPALGADGLTLVARDGGVSGRRTISVASTGITNLAGLQFNVVWPSDGVKLGIVRLGAGASGLGVLLEQNFILDTSSLGFFWFDPNLVGRGLTAGVVLFEFDLDANLVTAGKVPVTIDSVVASSPEAVIDLSGASIQVDFGGGAISPPTVTLKVGLPPLGGWMAPASVPLEALVDGQGNTVKNVQFVVDGKVVGEDSSAPYGLIWSNSGPGNKAVFVRVVYGTGQTVETVPIQVMIEAPTPTVTLNVGTFPVGGWIAPASVPLEAVVNTAGDSISAVQFLSDGEVIGESASFPYLFTWAGVGVGSRTIIARVVFGSGKILNSTGIPVTVSAGAGSGQQALTLAVTQNTSGAGKRTISVASTGLSNIAGLQFNVVWPTDTLTLGSIRIGPGGTALGVTLEQSFIVDPAGLGLFWFDPNLIGRTVAAGTVLFEFDVEAKPIVTGKIPVSIESVLASSPESLIGLAGAAAQVDFGGGATPPPVVKLVEGTAPAGGWISPASVPLEAQVDAQGNTITKVQFLADGLVVGEDATAPYEFTWANVTSGTKLVVARVFYGLNQSLASSALGVTVGSRTPIVGVGVGTAPAGGWVAPATIPLNATVAAQGNSITKVQFLADGMVIGEVLALPYAFDWENVTSGTRSVKVRVFHGAGEFTDSTPIELNIRGKEPTLGISFVAVPESGTRNQWVQVVGWGLSGISGLEFEVTWDGSVAVRKATRVGTGGIVLGLDSGDWFSDGSDRVRLVWYDALIAGKSVTNGAVLFEILLEPVSFTGGLLPLNVGSLLVADANLATIPASSAAVEVKFEGGGSGLPTVVLGVGTAPAGGWVAPATIPLSATVTAQGNTVTKVQFLADGQVVGEDVTTPYNFTWANVTSGTKLVVARVIYGSNQTVDSASVAVATTASGWQYQRRITLSNVDNGIEIVDVQVRITLNTGALIGSGKMNDTGRDIRFVGENGAEFPHWVQSGLNSDSTVIWVRVDRVPAKSSREIFLLYGNDSVANTSSGNQTFPFFDDFSGDLTRWRMRGGANAKVVGGKLLLTVGAPDVYTTLTSTQTFPPGYAAHFTEVRKTGGRYHFSKGFGDNTDRGRTSGGYWPPNCVATVYAHDGVSASLGASIADSESSINVPYSLASKEAEVHYQTGRGSLFVNQNIVGSTTTNVPNDSLSVFLWLNGWDGVQSVWEIDDVFVRKLPPSGLGVTIGTEMSQGLITLTEPQAVTAGEGRSLQLSASFTGVGPISYRWQKDGKDLADGDRVSGSATPVLTITRVAPVDNGEYRLTASNSTGIAQTKSVTVTVTVELKGPKLLIDSSNFGQGLHFDFAAPEGVEAIVETTLDLNAWSIGGRYVGRGQDNPIRISVPVDDAVRARFWRVRLQ